MSKKGFAPIVIVLIVALLVAGGITGYTYIKNKNKPIACAGDTKLCPDGNYVGRIPPNCEFAECPTVTITTTKPEITTIFQTTTTKLTVQKTTSNNVPLKTCECNSCESCTDALNSTCQLVELTTDIKNQSGDCIRNPKNFNNKTFDCQGYAINGNGSSAIYGIAIEDKKDNAIKNCVITDFRVGIKLYSSSNNTLTGNIANSNNSGNVGIALEYSSNNRLINNTAISNRDYGISLISSSNNTLTDNTVNSNGEGIVLLFSSNNILTNNTVKLNRERGIGLDDSPDNTLTANVVCNNENLDFQEGNSLDLDTHSKHNNNTCDKSYICNMKGECNDRSEKDCIYKCQ